MNFIKTGIAVGVCGVSQATATKVNSPSPAKKVDWKNKGYVLEEVAKDGMKLGEAQGGAKTDFKVILVALAQNEEAKEFLLEPKDLLKKKGLFKFATGGSIDLKSTLDEIATAKKEVEKMPTINKESLNLHAAPKDLNQESSG